MGSITTIMQFIIFYFIRRQYALRLVFSQRIPIVVIILLIIIYTILLSHNNSIKYIQSTPHNNHTAMCLHLKILL